jgi:hypothetical protein
VTGTGASEPTWVTAWPTGEVMPTASVLNLTPGVDAPNHVTALLGSGGRLSLYNFTGATDLVADVAGYLIESSGGGGAGVPGPQGPAGPQGPTGPVGPAGVSGVKPDLILRNPANSGQQVSLGTWEGVEIRAMCVDASNVSFQFYGSAGQLRIGGIIANTGGVSVVDTFGAVSASFVGSAEQHITGTMRNGLAARLVEIDLHVHGGDPFCTISGTVLPVV